MNNSSLSGLWILYPYFFLILSSRSTQFPAFWIACLIYLSGNITILLPIFSNIYKDKISKIYKLCTTFFRIFWQWITIEVVKINNSIICDKHRKCFGHKWGCFDRPWIFIISFINAANCVMPLIAISHSELFHCLIETVLHQDELSLTERWAWHFKFAKAVFPKS